MAGNLLKDAAPLPPGPAMARRGWTPGRIIALATGSALLLISLVLVAGSGMLAWADQEQLHAGYLTTSTASYSTGGYALAGDPISPHGRWGWLGRFADKVRIRVTSAVPGRPLVAGIAAAGSAERYLAGVSHATVVAFGDQAVTEHPGIAVPAAPAALHWAARAQGIGHLTLTWTVTEGDWIVVVMNPDGSKSVTIRADMAVSSAVLPALAGELLAAGLMLGLAADALIIVPVRLAMRPRQ